MSFTRPDIKYNPLAVEVDNIAKSINQSPNSSDDVKNIDAITNKLMDHLALIQDYNNKIDSVNWLIDNAKKLAGNLQYSTTDTALLTAIQTLGGQGSYVDRILFEKAIDLVIESYKQMALVSLTGAAN